MDFFIVIMGSGTSSCCANGKCSSPCGGGGDEDANASTTSTALSKKRPFAFGTYGNLFLIQQESLSLFDTTFEFLVENLDAESTLTGGITPALVEQYNYNNQYALLEIDNLKKI